MNSNAKIPMAGRVFGRLTVMAEAAPYQPPTGKRQAQWLCACECGEETIVRGSLLRRGISKSCGCLRLEVLARSARTHGLSSHSAFSSWRAMVRRCTDPNDVSYDDYGGRGITVCERWMSVAKFIADMGERPAGTTLDRIKNERGYEPGNCRWATPAEQARNTRRNTCTPEKAQAVRALAAAGVKKAAIARRLQLNRETVRGIANGDRWGV